jgi:hypothetical protein
MNQSMYQEPGLLLGWFFTFEDYCIALSRTQKTISRNSLIHKIIKGEY